MIASAGRLRSLANDAGRVPVLRGAVNRLYRRYFDGARGDVRMFRGLFPSFAAALAEVPADRSSSYDDELSARRVLNEWLGVYPNDYPVLFWLERLFAGDPVVFDWGGNVGLKYFAYRRYLAYPKEHRWLVAEVPAVVALGRTIAARESASALEFSTDLEHIGEAGILLASGVLNFIEDPFAMLRAAPHLPRHFVLNKVPVYDKPTAVTLHNMGTAVCPYRLFNRDELLHDVEQLGYRLVDEWRAPDVSCRIPFHPDHSIDAYSGFYFAMEA